MPENDTLNEPRVLFIGGTGRCGSSILREAFGNHSQCGVLPFEYRFMIDPDGIFDFYKSYREVWSPYNYDLRIKRLIRFLRTLAGGRTLGNHNPEAYLPQDQYKGWNLEERITGFNEMIDELEGDLIDFRYKGVWVGSPKNEDHEICFSHCRAEHTVKAALQKFVYSALDQLLKGMGKDIYIEDNTWNTLYAPSLLEFFPNAHLIHIYRHPYDVIESFQRQRWCPSDLKEAAAFYKSLIERWFEIKTQLPASRYTEICYEKFVTAPIQTYQRLCEIIGTEYQDAMNNIEIKTATVGQAEKRFSSDEIDLLNDGFSEYLETLGYK